MREARCNIGFEVLGPGKVARLHEASLHLMEKVGMRVGGERALKIFTDAGARVNGKGLLSIPAGLVDRALKTVPKELTLYDRSGDPYFTVTAKNEVCYGTHADQLEILDPETGAVREFLRKDTRLMCKVADALQNIRFVLSVGMSADVAPGVQSQVTFYETVTNFRKPVNFSTNDVASLQQIIDMAAAVAGGHDALRARPFCFNYCEPIPPLCHPAESTEKLLVSAQNGIPVVYMPYCMRGGTSPITLSGTLAQCNAEFLTGLALTQIAFPGAPVIYGSMPSIMDMKTTIGSYAAPEFHLAVAAASELSYHYGVPFYGTAGCCDAKFLDEQAVCEMTMELFSTVLGHANLVHDVGILDHCNNVSPEAVVLADEIITMLRAYAGGVSVTDEDLALSVIERVGPGAAYLNQPETVKNFRKVWYPKIFSRRMKNLDHSDVREKVRKRVAEIALGHEVPPLPASARARLDTVADRHGVPRE